jgi:hypothetical protein
LDPSSREAKLKESQKRIEIQQTDSIIVKNSSKIPVKSRAKEEQPEAKKEQSLPNSIKNSQKDANEE